MNLSIPQREILPHRQMLARKPVQTVFGGEQGKWAASKRPTAKRTMRTPIWASIEALSAASAGLE